jgi:CMP/dCMP kinase
MIFGALRTSSRKQPLAVAHPLLHESALWESDESLPQITLDGPSGVGKSTIGSAIASRLGWYYADSGLAYRALGALSRDECSRGELTALLRIAGELTLDFSDRELVARSTGELDLHCELTSSLASEIAEHPEIRAILTRKLQTLLDGKHCVVVGRDAGTAIAPRALLKVFLTATVPVRADRRRRQSGESLEAIIARDKRDIGRKSQPLRQASDAIVIDTERSSVSEIVQRIVVLHRLYRGGSADGCPQNS